MRTYLETHGKPVAFYSDKHGIFRVNAKDAAGGGGATQFGRALKELNIDMLCANSPQAKGRVERAFGTLQDRLVKELRLAGISAIDAANAWVRGFVEDDNKRFGRAPANRKDLHRPLSDADDLDEILVWREARTVTRNLTRRYDRMVLLLDPRPLTRGLAGKKVEVVNYPNGRFAVRHEGIVLPSGCLIRSKRWRRAGSSRTSGSVPYWHSYASSKPHIHRTVAGAILDAGGRQTIWRRQVCRQRAVNRSSLRPPLPPSEPNRCHFYFARAMSFLSCGDRRILPRVGQTLYRADRRTVTCRIVELNFTGART